MPEVHVIIVTYNGKEWIRTCLQNLMKTMVPVKILVIDNASSDDTTFIIKNNFPQITLIENEKNLGFGQANNIGMEKALREGADYVLLLNQDAYVNPGTIGKLLSVHEQHQEYGIISPLQLNAEGNQLDETFKRFISNNYPEEFVRKVETGDQDLPDLFPVRFVNAAAWLISRECLKKTGLFHPLFYHYGEDNNYCSRAQYHGFKAGITPLATVRHDKIYTNTGNRLLLRQIHLVPLYILLDLRKNIILAYVLVLWKLIGFTWKGLMRRSSEILLATYTQMKWIIRNISLIRHSRMDMKKDYTSIKRS